MASKNDAVAMKENKDLKRGTISEVGAVVSSAHLANSEIPAMSEMEFAMTMSNNAFHRWMVRCMAAAGAPGLSPLDTLIVHLVHHRKRPKTLADICLVLNMEDTHVVSYSIKKLQTLDLVTTGRTGKEKTVEITRKGSEICKRYGEIREELLIRAISQLGFEGEELSKLAALLRAISGSYDQAARAAAAM